jgi:hypothetical protein
MDESKYAQLEAKIEAQAQAIEEIRATQIKIANALLGSFDKNSVGIIEDVRTLKKSFDSVEITSQLHSSQINELQVFRNDMKKLVAGIALVVPIAFEIVKGLATILWEYLRSPK